MAEKIYHRRLAASHTTAKIASIEIKETESSISINGVQVPNSYKDIDLTRYIARLVSNKQGTSNKGKTNCSYLYGKDIEEQLLVDSWLSFVVDDEKKNQVEKLQYLDKSLSATSTTSKYLVGTTLTIADIVVFCWLENLQDKKAICVSNKLTHVERWSQFISSLPSFKNAEDKNQSQTKNSNPDTKEQGKFVELPGAELGKVVVRFPPEASGYLHIGHAKAALLNQYYQEQFKGRLIMRFDDTNPAKEKEDYEKVILEDVKLLEIKPDVFSYTSNYFDKMISLCEQMLKKGMAYVDDTDPETMKQEREKRIESKNRNNSVDKNVKLWNEMLSATPTGLKCCVRAKIDMLSDNGCMRDPAIYRCKPETHPRTGNKYKVYPTYDFACPIVDSLEGVTHALRTTEYADRDQQYYWFCDALELNPRPYVWSYSRLNMTNTVLSKRKLTWFVDEGLVDGWDDPRMPTVRGVLRRGMQVEALRQFIIAQGSSRTVVTMEWDKIWSINKRIVDPVAPRHTTVELNASVPVYVEDVKEPYVIKNVQRHPKNPDLGTKDVWITPTLLIDYVDAEGLASSGVGAKVTFINWGNVIVTKIDKNSSGKIESINIKTALNDTDYKKTTKLTWLPKIVPAENKSSDVPALVPCFCVFFNHLISKPVLAKDEDFKQYVSDLEDLSSCKTRLEVPMLGDPELRNVKKGQVIQLQRRPGYFICDTPYQPFSIHTSKECPVILFSVPDGHTKQQATVSSSNSAASEKKSNQAQTPNCANTTNQENELYTRVTDQGDKVRQLKSSGASKDVVSEAVKALLALKAEYKQASGKDYQPNQPPVKSAPTQPTNVPSTTNQEEQLYARVTEQGDKVRQLKSSGASKDAVSEAVKALLALKAEYKQAAGKDYQPNQPPAKSAPTQPTNVPSTTNQEEQLYARVTEQGDKVRQLKSSGASKDAVSEAVKALLALKAEYKQAAGKDYQPNQPPAKSAPTQPTNVPSTTNQEEQLYARVTEQGDKVRQLKSSGASKDAVSEAVKALLALKAEYKSTVGKEYQAGAQTSKPQSAPPSQKNVGKSDKKGDKKVDQKKKQEKSTASVNASEAGVKKITRLGLEAKKFVDLPDWYSQVLTKGEMIEYYDVSGCYVLRPWSFGIWEQLQKWFDNVIKRQLGVRNCYFPIFVSKAVLEKEKAHIEDFAPEVAWVTKSGDTELQEHIAIRPTSETVMYPAFAKWIQSYRDLPLKLNQWNNVVRWEFKHPQPFLRTREFLWQEGHHAYATQDEAERDVLKVLDFYKQVYEDLLAVPVVPGKKTEKEKFAGGVFTTTVEAYVPASGRAIQAATSHYLGTNFARMFDVQFEHPDTHQPEYAHQISYGMTTRTIGVMVMVHGDDRGLLLPPKVATVQVIIVPCGVGASTEPSVKDRLLNLCDSVKNALLGDQDPVPSPNSIRAETDLRDNYSPGWKFNHWELKGVPLRIEIGPKDMEAGRVIAIRRDTSEKIEVSLGKEGDLDSGFPKKIQDILDRVQSSMLEKARNEMNAKMVVCKDWSKFCPLLDSKHILLIPFCGRPPCEDLIKKDSAKDTVVEQSSVEGSQEQSTATMGAKSLCIPYQQPKEPENQIGPKTLCLHPECGQPAAAFTLFGRSY
ncbi:bifunctional glutamate/proline--tRNA ligase-like isoform X24 [Adelges cooleyi]|uniref:bifunctional glutamate/proline--tRNA ligase-like isoform X24 n=1 Tax=Adelges cooleyi TaxID=133065 RepID=UPI00217F9F11|nr:bifunctional glutamate/proline--tRNA ligase-like isoform X24 [Adelges cooleyi]